MCNRKEEYLLMYCVRCGVVCAHARVAAGVRGGDVGRDNTPVLEVGALVYYVLYCINIIRVLYLYYVLSNPDLVCWHLVYP